MICWGDEYYHPRVNFFQTIETSRQYNEKYPHFLSLQEYRYYYGKKEYLFGDMNMKNTRATYHKLLPTYSYDYLNEYENQPEVLAEKASFARSSAKLYVRERSYMYIKWLSIFIDGFRHWLYYGRWSSTGMSYQELWTKYEKKVRLQHPEMTEEELRKKVASTILEKACSTNPKIDNFALYTLH